MEFAIYVTGLDHMLGRDDVTEWDDEAEGEG